ncbi:MAG: hypothetical protein ACE5J3_08580 [Methanosarcinales archaeon]
MPIILEVNKNNSIVFPNDLVNSINIKPEDRFILEVESANTFVLKKIVKPDPLFDLLENPAHSDPEKIKKLDLSKLEEELWTN